MNSVATATGAAAAFLGAIFMLLPRWLFGTGRRGSRVGDLPRGGARRARAVAVGAVQAARARTRRQRAGRARFGGLRGGHRLGLRPPDRAHRARRSPPRCPGWPPTAMVFGINTMLVLVIVRHTDEHDVAGLGTAVLFVAATGSRGVRRHVRHPGRGSAMGTLRHGQRRARAGGDHPAGRGGTAAAGDDGRAGSCSAPQARWSSCVPTPPCRSTSTTRCAATSSRSRIRCSGCRSSPRSRCRPPSFPPTATRRALVVAGARGVPRRSGRARIASADGRGPNQACGKDSGHGWCRLRGRRSSCGERRTRRARRRPACGALAHRDPRAGVDHRAPDRTPAVDRPGRGRRRHRRSGLRRAVDRGGRESDGLRRRRRRGARRDPARRAAGRLAAHPDPAARRTARRHRRSQAARGSARR